MSFKTDDGIVHAVEDVSFDLAASETLGIVGESGSGKSVTSMAILGLLPASAAVTGEIIFDGENLVGRSEKQLQPIRGNRIAMVFQDALAALNPVHRVGDQIAEAIKVHHSLSKDELRDGRSSCSTSWASPTRANAPSTIPHEFSGGMRQRAMIAMAIANEPDVLIADEPTTALDVTIQAQVLDVLERIQERTHSSMLLITHDLGVVAGIADRVMVMYAGRQVELGNVDQIFYEPRHPYTRGLLGSLPRSIAAAPANGWRASRASRRRWCSGPRAARSIPLPLRRRRRLCVSDRAGDAGRSAGDHTSACHFATTLDRSTRRRA